MAKNKSSFMQELYAGAGFFDGGKVVEVLKSIISVQQEEHLLFPKSGVLLKADDKILAYCLVKKLLKIDGAVETDSVSAKEVMQKTGLKRGTVDPTIKKLKSQGFLMGKGSSYEIPSHQIEPVLLKLEKYKPSSKEGGL